MRDAEALVGAVAGAARLRAEDVLVASTGVIGRRYPLERILAGIAAMPAAAGRASRPSRPRPGS